MSTATANNCPTGVRRSRTVEIPRCPRCGDEFLPCRLSEDDKTIVKKCLNSSCGYTEPMKGLVGPPKEHALNSNVLRINGRLDLDKLPMERPTTIAAVRRERSVRKFTADITQQVIPEPVKNKPPENPNREKELNGNTSGHILQPVEIEKEEPMLATADPTRSKKESIKLIKDNAAAIVEDAKIMGVCKTARKWKIGSNSVYKLINKAKVKPGRPDRKGKCTRKPGEDKPLGMVLSDDALLKRITELESINEHHRVENGELRESVKAAAATCARLTTALETERTRAEHAEAECIKQHSLYESEKARADNLDVVSTSLKETLELWRTAAIEREAQIGQLSNSSKSSNSSPMVFTQTITLASGGSVALSFDGNVLACSHTDRSFVLDMFGEMRRHEETTEAAAT